MTHALGIDIGGTKCAVGVVNREGQVVARRRLATADVRSGDGVLAGIERLARSLLEEHGPVAAVGLALPGPVAADRRSMLRAQSLNELDGIDLVGWAERAFGTPARAENDGNAAALAEARFGAGRRAVVVCYFTISTGIGGGIVAGGRIFRGAHGLAGEFGHQQVEPDGPLCGCGRRGCLEAVASGTAIARGSQELANDRPESLLADPGFRRGRPYSAELVAEAARLGDEAAAHLWEQAGECLGIGIANVVNLLNPDCVVLGGGLIRAADLLFPSLQQALAEHAMPELLPGVRVVTAALGEDAGIVGAAALAREEL